MKKILFISPKGIAVNLAIKELQRLAEADGVSVEIKVMNDVDARHHLDEFDLVLVSPHYRFLLNLSQSYPHRPDLQIEVVDSKTFGVLDAQAMFSKIK